MNGSLIQEFSRNDESHDLVGALQNLMYSQVSYYFFNAVFSQVSVAAMHLQCVITNSWT